MKVLICDTWNAYVQEINVLDLPILMYFAKSKLCSHDVSAESSYNNTLGPCQKIPLLP